MSDLSSNSSSSSNHDDNDVDNKINNDDDDGASFSNRMKNLKLNPDVLKARSNQVEDPEKIKERERELLRDHVNPGKVSIEREGDPDSLVHYDMGQAIAWDGVEKSGVKEKFLTDKEISKVLHEESIEPEDNNDEAIAAALQSKKEINLDTTQDEAIAIQLQYDAINNSRNDTSESKPTAPSMTPTIEHPLSDELNSIENEKPIKITDVGTINPELIGKLVDSNENDDNDVIVDTNNEQTLTSKEGIVLLRTLEEGGLIATDVRRYHTKKIIDGDEGTMALIDAFKNDPNILAEELQAYADVPNVENNLNKSKSRNKSNRKNDDRVAKLMSASKSKKSDKSQSTQTATTSSMLKKKSRHSKQQAEKKRIIIEQQKALANYEKNKQQSMLSSPKLVSHNIDGDVELTTFKNDAIKEKSSSRRRHTSSGHSRQLGDVHKRSSSRSKGKKKKPRKPTDPALQEFRAAFSFAAPVSGSSVPRNAGWEKRVARVRDGL